MANKYGWGIHEVTYRQCPNCGAETHSQTVTTPHVGIHMRRCYECCPWWRTSTILPLTAVLLMFPALLFGFAMFQSATLGLPVADWILFVLTTAASVGLFWLSGPK